MATHLMIYKSAVAVSKERHADCSVEATHDYDFCARINSSPLLAVEFPSAAGEFPIVFAGPPGEIMPTAILGVRDRENLFVTRRNWTAKYVPAFLRRYPFVFSREGDQFVLCIDDSYPGLNREGRGQRLFDGDATPTAYLDGIVKFLNDYHRQHERTREFCGRLWELGLLESTKVQVKVSEEMQFSLAGFMAVDRSRLRGLGGEKLETLARTDELEMLYLHLQSLRNFDRLREKVAAQRGVVIYPATTEDAATLIGGPKKRYVH